LRACRLGLPVAASLLAMSAMADAQPSVPAVPAESSDDLGTIGPTWPIAEHDLLDLMLDKVRQKQNDGEVGQLEEQLHDRSRDYVAHPPSLHLARATQDSARRFDPTLVLPYDIHDAKGHVLWPKGTRVNPLEHRSFDETLVFIDGDDSVQVAWLRHHFEQDRHHAMHDKVVLTGGSPATLAQQLNSGTTFYSDQDGRLVAKFGIEAVPATVGADPDAPRRQLLIRTYDPLAVHP
jgi:conjugal transfer pilus assembly protein TraW